GGDRPLRRQPERGGKATGHPAPNAGGPPDRAGPDPPPCPRRRRLIASRLASALVLSAIELPERLEEVHRRCRHQRHPHDVESIPSPRVDVELRAPDREVTREEPR